MRLCYCCRVEKSVPGRPARFARGLITVSLGATLVALLFVAWQDYAFYTDTAGFAPGTGVRPLGLALWICLAGFTSIIMGFLCFFWICLLPEVRKRPRLLVVAGMALLISASPLFLGIWGARFVAAERKLVMEE